MKSLEIYFSVDGLVCIAEHEDELVDEQLVAPLVGPGNESEDETEDEPEYQKYKLVLMPQILSSLVSQIVPEDYLMINLSSLVKAYVNVGPTITGFDDQFLYCRRSPERDLKC